MKFTQKTKYFIFGAIATAVLVPLGTYAVKTILNRPGFRGGQLV